MIRAGMAVLTGGLLAAAAVARTPTTPQAPATPAAPAQAEPVVGSLPNGTALNAQLNSSVDSKKAKVGDKVEAHTTAAVEFEGKTLVPKGAKLEGHVTEATARSKGDQGSSLAIQFDKAVPKKGEEVPLNVLIMAVAPPQQNTQYAASPTPGSEPMSDRGAATAGGSPMGASRPQSTATGNPNYPTGSVPGSGSSTDTSGPSTLPSNSRGIYGLKDLKLMEHKSQTGQTTVITSEGKNVHLDGGTRLLLVAQGASAAPAPAPSR